MKRILLLSGVVLLLLVNVTVAGAQSTDSQLGNMPVFERFLENNKVVIDDAVLQLADNFRLFDGYNTPLQPSDFQEGQRVGIMVNNNGEIVMMWKVE